MIFIIIFSPTDSSAHKYFLRIDVTFKGSLGNSAVVTLLSDTPLEITNVTYEDARSYGNYFVCRYSSDTQKQFFVKFDGACTQELDPDDSTSYVEMGWKFLPQFERVIYNDKELVFYKCLPGEKNYNRAVTFSLRVTAPLRIEEYSCFFNLCDRAVAQGRNFPYKNHR